MAQTEQAAAGFTWSDERSERDVHVMYRCKRCSKVERVTYRQVRTRTYRSDRIAPTFDRTTLRNTAGVESYGWDPRECCGKLMAADYVSGRYNPAKECDDRCTHAVGHRCECQCGGRYHGSAHEAAR